MLTKAYSDSELTVSVREEETRLEVVWLGRSLQSHADHFIWTVLHEVTAIASKLQKPIHMDFRKLEQMSEATSRAILRTLADTSGGNSIYSVTYDSSQPWQEVNFKSSV